MTWVLHSTDESSVYWRREADGYVIGFNRQGVGEPSSGEDAPPADIDAYAPPIAETAPIEPRFISRSDFLKRLGPTRMGAILMAAKQSIEVEVWVVIFNAAPEVDLNDDRTINGLAALELAGVLPAGTADEVLA